MTFDSAQKPRGPRLPAAKDADKLIDEGLLAVARGRWQRAERRFLAARAQLGQVEPVSWRAFRAGHLLLRLRLARGDLAAAAQAAREQLDLAQRLGPPPDLDWLRFDLAFILGDRAGGEGAGEGSRDLDQALERLQALLLDRRCHAVPDSGRSLA